MWIFAVAAGVVALGFYEYVVKPNLPSAQVGGPAPAETFTSGGKIKVGDTVTVSAVSLEPSPFEDHMANQADVDAGRVPPVPVLSEQDQSIVNSLEALTDTGGTVDLIVTATGLITEGTAGRVPASIGVVQAPGLSVRIPMAFLNASVQRIVRDGKVIT